MAVTIVVVEVVEAVETFVEEGEGAEVEEISGVVEVVAGAAVINLRARIECSGKLKSASLLNQH